MTFELLKVCRQANPAWIELRVMYVSSTVTDRHARWVIINQNYCIKESNYLFFFISLFRFVFYFFPSIFFISVYFVLLSLVSFHFGSISLISFRFVSFRFRWFRFVSFRFYFVSFLFRFALYRYPANYYVFWFLLQEFITFIILNYFALPNVYYKYTK